MMITGNVHVDKRFLERARNVVIDKDDGELTEEAKKSFQDFASACKSNNTKVIVQLNHAGRQSSKLIAKESLAPSAVPVKGSAIPLSKPRAATLDQVEDMIDRFVFASKVCEDCGFDGVQIHAAHGYLLSSFLNPLANKREDKFGGSLENRVRALMETVKRVKAARTGKNFSISVKLNSSDFQKGGFSVQEATQVAVLLAKEGIDFVELSGGNYESPKMIGNSAIESENEDLRKESTKKREAFFLHFAAEIVKEVQRQSNNVAVMVTGGFRSATAINDALSSKECDLVGIGRPLCVDTKCTQRLLNGEIESLPMPERYLNLPTFLGSKFMLSFKTFSDLRMGATMMTFYSNLIAMGKGTFAPKEKPNILMKTMRQQKYDNSKVKDLKGYQRLCNDPFIQKTLID